MGTDAVRAVLKIQNPRWDGVPFILKCGKALGERKAEIRIQFKPPAGALFSVDEQRNELVLRLQPDESVYLKVNVKQPGLSTDTSMAELDLAYKCRFRGIALPEAYERLILDVLRGERASFVRADELLAAWKIYSPLLKELEDVVPLPYKYGSRGPPEADALMEASGFKQTVGYRWIRGTSCASPTATSGHF